MKKNIFTKANKELIEGFRPLIKIFFILGMIIISILGLFKIARLGVTIHWLFFGLIPILFYILFVFLIFLREDVFR